MSNNLLDALKHAGLANEKQARKAENAKKQQEYRDQKRGEVKEVVVKAESPDPQAIRQQTALNAEAQIKERLAQVYRQAAVSNGSGRRKFYFQTIDRCLDCLMISDVASALLDRGKYAIVANEQLDDYIVVRRATALAIEAIDKKRIIVLKRQEI